MPELPDVVVYLEALRSRILGERLERVRLMSPFLLRSVDPPVTEAEGRTVTGLRRLGKRIVIALAPTSAPSPAGAPHAEPPPAPDIHLVIHLMIAGRLRWREPGAKVPRKLGLAAFDFPAGTLLLTEAGTKKRASLHVVRGTADLAAFDRGGLEVLDSTRATFAATLARENHTLKRALTDPRLLSGIGNAYSDEILHRARLSPMKLTSKLDDDETARLWEAAREVLTEWMNRLRAEAGTRFPEKVTAFREGMAVHGRYRKPCPVCGTEVQRIVYAENECNYCPRCQTGGRVLADRSLSRLLKDDWPRRIEELEEARKAPE